MDQPACLSSRAVDCLYCTSPCNGSRLTAPSQIRPAHCHPISWAGPARATAGPPPCNGHGTGDGMHTAGPSTASAMSSTTPTPPPQAPGPRHPQGTVVWSGHAGAARARGTKTPQPHAAVRHGRPRRATPDASSPRATEPGDVHINQNRPASSPSTSLAAAASHSFCCRRCCRRMQAPPPPADSHGKSSWHALCIGRHHRRPKLRTAPNRAWRGRSWRRP